MMSIVQLHGLRKEYSSLVAVDDVSFSVEPGQVVGLIGPNGAGKTTLLRMLATLLPPTDGTATVCGADLRKQPSAIRRSIGYLPDFFNLYPDLTLRECLDFFTRAYGAYIGILRRFTREYEALFSRAGAAVFLLSFMVMLCGLFYNFFFDYDAADAGRAFWMIGLLPVAAVPLFAMRSFDKYLEITRTAHRVKGLWGRLLVHSNVVSGLILYAIWLAFAVSVGVTVEAAFSEMLWLVMLSFSAYLVILGLLETYALWQAKNEKIGYVVGFAGILYFVLPLILAAMFENEALTVFSPFGIIGIFGEDYEMLTLLMPVLLNLVWLLPLGLLIGKRYGDLVVLRTGMEKSQADVSAA
jgi:ABC-type Fe3+/spermidine/putrescine transport system ATPase subunit